MPATSGDLPGDETARPQQRHPGRAHVTAVLHVRRGGPDLHRVLDALEQQTRPCDATVALAGTSALVAELSQRLPHVAPADPRACVPASPAALQTALSARGAAPGVDDGAEWLWLLRDAVAPAPDALAHLLHAVELGPSIAVAGCKQRDWDDEHLLHEAGFTTTRWGRRITGVERGDVDQGQLDHREDVLAVSTDGMLVRRSLVDQLGGADPALTGPAAALDLCRRARLAGHRVVVVPPAVVRSTAPGHISRAEATHLRLVHAERPVLPLVALAVLAGAFGRLLLRVAAKDAGRGVRDLVQTLRVLARPDRLWRSRRAAARTRTRPRGDLSPLLVGARDTARWHRDRWFSRRARTRTVRPADAERRTGPRQWLPPVVLTVLLTTVSLLVWHRLLGPGPVSGGALAAAPASVGDLAESLRSGWRATGLGSPGAADPLTAVLLGASLLLGGATQAAVTSLLVAALPLAGLGAWCAAGRATRSLAVRGWAALTWCAAPALLVASGTGRLGPVLAHALLPYVVWAVAATVRVPRLRYAWTPAAAGGIVLAAVVAGAPVLLLPAVLTVLVVGAAARSRALPLLWTLVPALALCGPWLVDAVQSPRALFADPGVLLASTPAAGWQQLLGHPVAPAAWPLGSGPAGQLLPLAASGVVVLAALAALTRGGPSARVVRLGWVVAALGLATAAVSSRVHVGAGVDSLVTGWPGPGLSLALAGLVTAAVVAADGSMRRVGGTGLGWRRVGAGMLVAVAVLAPACTLGVWAARTTADPPADAPTRASGLQLPEVAVDVARSGDRVRTMVLAATDDAVTVALVRGAAPSLLDTSTLVVARSVVPPEPWQPAAPAAPDAADTALDTAAGLLVRGGADPRPALGDLAVGHVMLVPGPGVDDLARTLDATVGLTRAGQSGDTLVWRVEPASGQQREGPDRPAALRLVDAAGLPTAVLAAGRWGTTTTVPASATGEPRTLVLPERADDGWTATLDGRRLEPVTHAGWAQAFSLPPDGGRLVVGHDVDWAGAWRVGQGAVALLTVLLALPMAGARRDRSGA